MMAEMTFNADGTYRFWFAAYSIEDLGTYTYENGVLTLTDKNGKQSVGEGNPVKLHYAYSDSDQLTGDFTVPVSAFESDRAKESTSSEASAAAETASAAEAVPEAGQITGADLGDQ